MFCKKISCKNAPLYIISFGSNHACVDLWLAMQFIKLGFLCNSMKVKKEKLKDREKEKTWINPTIPHHQEAWYSNNIKGPEKTEDNCTSFIWKESIQKIGCLPVYVLKDVVVVVVDESKTKTMHIVWKCTFFEFN